MLLTQIIDKKLLKSNPPPFLKDNCQYLTTMGSIAYGTSLDTSDFDVYGFTIPPKNNLFPHLDGQINGFGKQVEAFDQWQEHHIFDKDALGGKGRTYDFTIFGIARYFSLALDNNPNVIDSLFTPVDCVLHCTHIGNLVRDNRKLFLHKGVVAKLKGYAFSQLHKASSQTREGKRAEEVDKVGWDTKFLGHVVRLTLQAQQILTTGDLDLRLDREHIKAVRRGEITLDEVRAWFTAKETYLDKLYEDSKLRSKPDTAKIRQLLLDCLEHHYGDLSSCVKTVGKAEQVIKDISNLIYQSGFGGI